MAATAAVAPAFSLPINNGTSSAKVYYNAETLDACNAAPTAKLTKLLVDKPFDSSQV